MGKRWRCGGEGEVGNGGLDGGRGRVDEGEGHGNESDGGGGGDDDRGGDGGSHGGEVVVGAAGRWWKWSWRWWRWFWRWGGWRCSGGHHGPWKLSEMDITDSEAKGSKEMQKFRQSDRIPPRRQLVSLLPAESIDGGLLQVWMTRVNKCSWLSYTSLNSWECILWDLKLQASASQSLSSQLWSLLNSVTTMDCHYLNRLTASFRPSGALLEKSSKCWMHPGPSPWLPEY